MPTLEQNRIHFTTPAGVHTIPWDRMWSEYSKGLPIDTVVLPSDGGDDMDPLATAHLQPVGGCWCECGEMIGDDDVLLGRDETGAGFLRHFTATPADMPERRLEPFVYDPDHPIFRRDLPLPCTTTMRWMQTWQNAAHHALRRTT